MRIGIFGGSFDPVHTQHVAFVAAAKKALFLDRVIVMPSCVAPHKSGGAVLGGKDRARLLRIAFRGLPYAEVSEYELDAGGTSYTYLTCRALRAEYREDELFFLVGADMLENFFSWRNPDDILSHATLAVCGRGAEDCEQFREKFFDRFQRRFLTVPFTGEAVSSSAIRIDLFFGKESGALDPAVAAEIRDHGFYRDEKVLEALALETERRREHSYRVAKMAVSRAKSAGVDKNKALYAAALHDCAKYVPLTSPLLSEFEFPKGVPEPVMHQYTGAYLAEHIFGVTDGEILDAIRYHASGKEDMTALGKLIYLADLLEEGRSFFGMEMLREAFRRDLDECMLLSLSHQLAYLRSCGDPVYELTERAYQWLKEKQ